MKRNDEDDFDEGTFNLPPELSELCWRMATDRWVANPQSDFAFCFSEAVLGVAKVYWHFGAGGLPLEPGALCNLDDDDTLNVSVENPYKLFGGELLSVRDDPDDLEV